MYGCPLPRRTNDNRFCESILLAYTQIKVLQQAQIEAISSSDFFFSNCWVEAETFCAADAIVVKLVSKLFDLVCAQITSRFQGRLMIILLHHF